MEGICKRLLFFILILGVFFLSQTVFAQENTEQKDLQKTEQKKGQTSSHNLEEITVTGNKTKEPVTSPYAVTESSQLQTDVWTREEIETLHPQTVFDIIEQVPGMQVQFQGRWHVDLSNMRGTGNYGVILDGVYVTQADRILATIPVDTIESMTVVRDSTALTLGPVTNFGSTTGDSNQGFIIIKTKRASKLEGGTVDSYGSEHTQKEHLYLGDKIGNFDFRIAGTENSTLGKTGWYDASRNESVLFRGGYTRPSFEADILYYSGRGMRELQRAEIVAPTAITKAGKIVGYNWSQVGQLSTSKWKMDPITDDMVAVNLNKHWNDKQTTTFSYAYASLLVNSMTSTFPDGPGQKTTVYDQNDRGQSASLRHVITSHNNILKLGGQWNDWVELWDTGNTSRYDEDMFGLYAQDEYHMLNDRLTFDAGIRGDKIHYSNSPVTSNHVDDWDRPAYSYTLGAAFKLIPKITLTGRYAYTENNQSGYETSAVRTILPAEKRSRYEGGIKADIHLSFNPWLTVYYYDTKNQKTPTGGSFIDPATGEEVDYVSTSDVMTRGAEFGSSGQILKGLTYRIQYTYLTTNDQATNNSMAHNMASGLVSYRYKRFDANLSFQYMSSFSRTAYYQLGGYSRVDANVGYNCKIFDRDTKITVFGRNLGNKAYATRYVAGVFYDPGITYGVELSFSFF